MFQIRLIASLFVLSGQSEASIILKRWEIHSVTKTNDSNCAVILSDQGKAATASNLSEYVPDHVGTLAQVGTSPNSGWPNKELGGSQPI